MKQDGRKNNGGFRPGSGRKPANYKTVTVSFRVRKEWAEPVKEAVKKKIAQLKKTIQTLD